MNSPRYRGYIGSRMALGRSVPQNIQQMVIRDYCHRHKLKFMLSATEYVMEGSTMMLDAILDENNAGIVFYSIALLPKDLKKRKKLYESGKNIRFAAENIHELDENLFETIFFVSEYHAGTEFPRTIAYLNTSRPS